MKTNRAEIIRRGLERWGTAASGTDDEEVQAAIEEMADGYLPDCELDFTRTLPDFPASRGPEAMVRWMQGARATLGEVTFSAGEITETGDAVVVPVQVNARTRGNGEASIRMDFAYVFRFRGDKIAAATTYQTVEEALKAAAGSP